LQAAIKNEFGITANLKEGSGGIFDVHIDGERVYSKSTTHRFPTNEEISEKIRQRLKK
jgi:selT/selW/selH-like putative selenoprotein